MKTAGMDDAPRRAAAGGGFTLVELMVATAILALILGLLFTVVSQVSALWKHSSAEIEAFQNARAAYQMLTMRLSQATLNTYLDYYNADKQPRTPSNTNAGDSFIPRYYARNSDLHFVVDQASALVPNNGQPHPGQAVFFQAPLGFTLKAASYSGLPTAMNACGYYVEFNSDRNINHNGLPAFLQSLASVEPRWRFRLMEFYQPTESLTVFTTPKSGSASDYNSWFTSFLPQSATYEATTPQRSLHAIADNIIVLIVLPVDQDGALLSSYGYDTRSGDITAPTHHQLPALLRVVMIAVDEPSMLQLTPPGSTTAPPAVTGALANRFQNPASLDEDIAAVTRDLIDARINYRVFDTNVAIPGGKWSEQ